MLSAHPPVIRHTSAPHDRKQHRCVLSTCSVT